MIAAEDRTFCTNNGIDPKGIIRAAFNDARGGATQGASTITQQYVKILYLTQERSLSRKIHEAILSLKLQKQQSKDEILEGYLNTIYFGRGAYGVQAAAKAYFGVDAKDLNLRAERGAGQRAEQPLAVRPGQRQEQQAGAARALPLRAGRHGLDGQDHRRRRPQQAAKRLPKFPVFKESSQYGGQKGHMLTLVRQELHQLGFTDDQIDGGGLRVTTTFTPKAMAAAEAGVLAGPARASATSTSTSRSPPSQPGTGALLGFYGGQDYLRLPDQLGRGRRHGRARPSSRSRWPPAITDGYSLKSTLDGNSPYVFPDGLEVHNEGAGDGHRLRLRGDLDLRASSSRSTPRSSTCRQHAGRAGEDPVDGQQDGDPAGARPTRTTRASRHAPRDLERRRR